MIDGGLSVETWSQDPHRSVGELAKAIAQTLFARRQYRTSCGRKAQPSDGKTTRSCHANAPEPMPWPLARASNELSCGFKGCLDCVSKKADFSQESPLLGRTIRIYLRTDSFGSSPESSLSPQIPRHRTQTHFSSCRSSASLVVKASCRHRRPVWPVRGNRGERP